MATINDAGGDALTDEYGRPIIDELQDPRPASADYADAEAALLPSGRAWSKEPGSVLSGLLSWLAPTVARLTGRASYLLTDSPAGDSLLEMLPEWEATLGLPDPCAGALPTIELRQAAVKAKIAARGGQSVPYFVGLGAALATPITITEFKPFCAGDPCGQPCYGDDWASTWQANAPATVVTYFDAGSGRAGDPLASWGNQSLYCTLQRLKPAHTALLISYS